MRVRFCPSPTGTPHVGLVRTALFNWAYPGMLTAGTFCVPHRGHPTPPATRGELHEAILEALRWLGLDWDEGVQSAALHGLPYRQS